MINCPLVQSIPLNLTCTLSHEEKESTISQFLISHGEDIKQADNKCGDKFAAYEVVRSIFALTKNTNTAPPVATDTELIWSFERILDNKNINAKLRIASYLNAQSDKKLYFEV